METGETLLGIMEDVQIVLQQCRPRYAEYARVQEQAKRVQKKKIWLILALMIAAAWSFLAIISIKEYWQDGNLFYSNYIYSGYEFDAAVIFWLISMPLCVAGVYFDIRAFKRLPTELEMYERKGKEILSQLDDFYHSSKIAGRYPQMYLYDDAVSYCIELANNMRADSVKEAINLYEENLHRIRMEDLQRQNVKLLEKMQKDTNQARKAAQFAAVFSGITAYNTAKIRKDIRERL